MEKAGKKILVITPTPTHPQNAGNRMRIYRLLLELQKMGHEIHLLYCDYEKGEQHVERQADLEAMCRNWDGFYYVPQQRIASMAIKVANFPDRTAGQMGRVLRKNAPRLYKLLKKVFPDGALSIVRGRHAVFSFFGKTLDGIDAWYDPALDNKISTLAKKNEFDVVLVEYVFMSKALECFGDNVFKIIDTHDVFTKREEKYQQAGLDSGSFFSLNNPRDEAQGLNRADALIAIHEKEKEFFSEISDRSVVVVGHLTDVRKPQGRSRLRYTLLFIGAANPANIHALEYFIKRVFPEVKTTFPQAALLVAGKISDYLPHKDGCITLGELAGLDGVYEAADIVVNPTSVGTGFKIKTIEALAYGKPLVTTSHAAAGLPDKYPAYIKADTAKEFSNAIIKIFSDINLYNTMSFNAYRLANEYNNQVRESLELLFSPNVMIPQAVI